MKKVLFITYFWPPSGKASLHWPLAMINHLPKYGWQPSVLTVDEDTFTEPDESLLNEIDENLRVIKTKTFEPFNIYKRFIGKSKDEPLNASEAISQSNDSFANRISIWIRMNLFIPDARAGWCFFATKEGKRLLKKNNFDAIVSIGPPHTAHLIGNSLSKKFKLPHFPVFIDPWVDIVYYKNFKRNKLTLSVDNHFEKKVLRDCRQAIFITKTMREDYIVKYNFLDKKSKVLYWGYSEKYFSDLNIQTRSDEEVIVHAGNIFDYQNPKKFWMTLKNMIDTGRKIKIKFIGTVGPEIKKTIKETGLSDNTEYAGFLPYKEMLNELINANYLLVCTTERRHVPGKLFEYLRIGKPIIAFGDDNEEIKQIIEGANAGKLFNYNEGAEEMFDTGNLFFRDKSKIEIYERKNIAKELGTILDTNQVSFLYT